MVPDPAAATAEITGIVRTADAARVPDLSVTIQDLSGAVRAKTTTDTSGAFQVTVAVGQGRLVIGSGARNRQSERLPGWFELGTDVGIAGDRRFEITLPRAYQTSVAATDAAGAPLPGASVAAETPVPVTAARLWPGSSPVTGSQQPAPQAVGTGADGRAPVWAFPAPQIGPIHVDHTGPDGAAGRATIDSLDLAGDQLVVAVPSRPACRPRRVPDLGTGPARLVADLDAITVRESAAKPALLRTADEIVAGTVPQVTYNATFAGDPQRYLYDEGVALRRVTGILAYAYAATKDPRYLDAMATGVALNAARWPDWNPGHPLDTAQVATAVALAYGWAGHRLPEAERGEVVRALTTRMTLAYSCDDGPLAPARGWAGNRNTVVATAATLAGLAVRNEATAWASAAVADGLAALARFRTDDGSGRSIAAGPTVEGFMYTAYEAANVALLHATRRLAEGADPVVADQLTAALPDLDRLAAWTERCGSALDDDMHDGWDVYPWVDRATGLAALTAWPSAGGHTLEVIEALQARATMAIPERGSWTVPDGIAELILSTATARTEAPPPVEAHASGAPGSASYWGCALNGDLRAVLGAAPNDAPHAHRDVGNVLVRAGEQEVLADLGQRDYRLTGVKYVWRALTKAHTTVGVLAPDGRVMQQPDGAGAVAVEGNGLVMTSSSALADTEWRRSVQVGEGAVSIRDELTRRTAGEAVPMSMSFLLATPPERVEPVAPDRLRFTVADGSAWELVAPAGTRAEFSDATPTPPYADTAEFGETLGPAHTLVTVEFLLESTRDLTTSLVRASAAASAR